MPSKKNLDSPPPLPAEMEVNEKKPRARKARTEYVKWLGDKVKVLRRDLGISQAELAVRLSVPRSSLSKWETGDTVMSVEEVAKVARVLGVNVGTLLGLDAIRTTDATHERLMRLFDAEGRKLASQILGLSEETWGHLLEGHLQFSLQSMKELAIAYNVSLDWLQSGNPNDWKPNLADGVSTRLRFLRICLGQPIPEGDDDWQALEVSNRYANEHIEKADRVIDTWRAVVAMNGEANKLFGQRFPFDFGWVKTGQMGFDAK